MLLDVFYVNFAGTWGPEKNWEKEGREKNKR